MFLSPKSLSRLNVFISINNLRICFELQKVVWQGEMRACQILLSSSGVVLALYAILWRILIQLRDKAPYLLIVNGDMEIVSGKLIFRNYL